jgi:hypothetical protein
MLHFTVLRVGNNVKMLMEQMLAEITINKLDVAVGGSSWTFPFVKLKRIKVTLYHATKAQRGGRGAALLLHSLGAKTG